MVSLLVTGQTSAAVTHIVELASNPTLLMLLKSRKFDKSHMMAVIATAQTIVASLPPRMV